MTVLTAGDELDLVGADTKPLTTVRMGVGWDKARNAGFIGNGTPEVDLDASALQYGAGQLCDLAFFNNLRTRDGAVVHLGDNTSGSGEGDDETITVDLENVWDRVDTIVFTVSSFQGHSLQWVHNAYCRLTDDDDVEIARFTLSLGVPETGLVLAVLVREGAGWRLRAIGEGIAMTKPTEALEVLKPYVG